MDADLEPHAGRVFVDWCARRCEWRLTHTTTYESIGVGAELACLAWTDEGFAYIVGGDGGDAAEKDVDEVFRWHLARSVGDGRLVVLEPPQQGDAQRPFYFLDSVRLEFEEKQFGFPLGCTGQQHKFALAIFARRRNGFRCFWSLSGVYKSLGFDMFSKCASRWAWQSLPRFEKSVSHLGSEQVLRSQCYQDPGPDASLEDRCLPFHAASTPAMLWLLTQWAIRTTRHGGLKQFKHRQAAEAFFIALVAAACPHGGQTVDLLVDDTFAWRWPRPSAGDHPFTMTILDLEWRLAGQRQIFLRMRQWLCENASPHPGVAIVHM